MRDQQDAEVALRLRQHTVDAVGDDFHRVDVQPRIGLIHDRDFRLQHRHLQDLEALLLTAGEAFVHVPGDDRRLNPQLVQLLLQELLELADWHQFFVEPAARRHGRAQEAAHGHPGDADRILKGDKQSPPGALVGRHGQEVLTLVEDFPLHHLIEGIAHQDVGQGGFAGPVRAHQRVHFPLVEGEVGPLQDDLLLNLHCQVPDLQISHACSRRPQHSE